jgi:hypothetical protein
VIDLLHILLKIQSPEPVPGKVRLGWFAAFYQDAMSFVRADDYVAIRDLLASATREDAFEAFRATAPGVARAAGLTDENQRVGWNASRISSRRRSSRPSAFARRFGPTSAPSTIWLSTDERSAWFCSRTD